MKLSLMLSALAVAVGCVAVGGLILGLMGYQIGMVVTRPAILGLMLVGVAQGLVQWQVVRRGRLITAIRRTTTRPDQNLEACEFHLAGRVPYTVVLASLGGGPLVLALGLLVVHLAAPSAVAAGVAVSVNAVVLLPSAALLWCAVGAWNARVAFTPDGVRVRMLFTSGTFTWNDLIGFERVALRDSNGSERWWLRFVTARRAYLFPDEVNERESLIATVTQATGLKLVNVA